MQAGETRKHVHKSTCIHERCRIDFCMCCAAVSSAGYKYLASRMKDKEDEKAEQAAQDDFLLQLDEVEGQLSKHSGPYLVGYTLQTLHSIASFAYCCCCCCCCCCCYACGRYAVAPAAVIAGSSHFIPCICRTLLLLASAGFTTAAR